MIIRISDIPSGVNASPKVLGVGVSGNAELYDLGNASTRNIGVGQEDIPDNGIIDTKLEGKIGTVVSNTSGLLVDTQGDEVSITFDSGMSLISDEEKSNITKNIQTVVSSNTEIVGGGIHTVILDEDATFAFDINNGETVTILLDFNSFVVLEWGFQWMTDQPTTNVCAIEVMNINSVLYGFLKGEI